MTAPPSPWLARRNPIDRVVCAVAALVLAPVAAVIAAVIRATSPGPAVIGLSRVGRGREAFRMWKFRSMRATTATGAASGAAITAGGDDRITPVGRVLRAWRLDEIPQLWNVVRGDMSLIGPRPEAAEFVDDDPRWRAVLQARPAIAGPTQLLVHEWEAGLTGADEYRTDILPVKLAIDAWYVEHASPLLDAKVVSGLAQSMLLGRTDSALHRAVRAAVPEAAAIPRPSAGAAAATGTA